MILTFVIANLFSMVKVLMSPANYFHHAPVTFSGEGENTYQLLNKVVIDSPKLTLSTYATIKVMDCFFYKMQDYAVYCKNGEIVDSSCTLVRSTFLSCKDSGVLYESQKVVLDKIYTDNATTTVRAGDGFFVMAFLVSSDATVNDTMVANSVNCISESLYYYGGILTINNWNLTNIKSSNNTGMYFGRRNSNVVANITYSTIVNNSGLGIFTSQSLGFEKINIRLCNIVDSKATNGIFGLYVYDFFVYDTIFVNIEGNLTYVHPTRQMGKCTFIDSYANSEDYKDIKGVVVVANGHLETYEMENFFIELAHISDFETNNYVNVLKPQIGSNTNFCEEKNISHCVFCIEYEGALRERYGCIQCEKGFRLEVTHSNDMGKCVPLDCEMENCRMCVRTDDGENHCLVCKKGYTLDANSMECVSI